jgi:hypothetical protein
MRRVLVWTCALAVVALPSCSTTTEGNGQPQTASTATSPDFPSAPQSEQQSDPQSEPPSTTAPTTSAAPSTSSAPSKPTIRQREGRLTAQTNGAPHEIVALRDGAEAATYNETGGIAFWRSTGSSANWAKLGASRYPAEVTGRPYHVSVSGALLTRMKHATYIVTGQFTTDNSGRAVAYTTGGRGWGAIKAESNGDIGPSGEPVGANRIGLSYDFEFVGGQLKTEDCPSDQPIATCGSTHVDKLWAWTGQDFKRS